MRTGPAIIKIKNVLNNIINPATEEKQDDVILNQTDGTQKTQIVYGSGLDSVDVQTPLPTDGDSVYSKDINVSGSSVGTFTGAITSLFDDLDTSFTSTGHSSPATFTIKLNRPINNDSVKLCSEVGDNFSNVKIMLKDRGGTILETIDDSANNTKYTSNTYDYPLTPWCSMVVEFHTTDDIGINWALMEKSLDVHAILRVRVPTGTYTDMSATANGNPKMAIEEYDEAVNPILRVNDPLLTAAYGSNPLASDVSYINKFGRNSDIDTAASEDVWDAGGLWVPPTQARTHDIVSTVVNDIGSVLSSGTATGGSTESLVDTGADFVGDGVAVGDTVLNDTNSDHGTVIAVAATILTLELTAHANDPDRAGHGFNSGDSYRVVNATSTGASVIHISGMDENLHLTGEHLVMNGTTNVPTIKTYYRIYRLSTIGAGGRTVNNVGDISATAQTDGTVTAQMNAGNGVTGMAVYTIPKGKTGYMTQMYADLVRGKSGTASLTLRKTPIATTDGAGSRVSHFFGLESTSGHYHHMFKPYKKFLENTDVWIRVDEVSTNDMDISAGFDLILVDN